MIVKLCDFHPPKACFCNNLEMVETFFRILGTDAIDLNAKDNQVFINCFYLISLFFWVISASSIVPGCIS